MVEAGNCALKQVGPSLNCETGPGRGPHFFWGRGVYPFGGGAPIQQSETGPLYGSGPPSWTGEATHARPLVDRDHNTRKNLRTKTTKRDIMV